MRTRLRCSMSGDENNCNDHSSSDSIPTATASVSKPGTLKYQPVGHGRSHADQIDTPANGQVQVQLDELLEAVKRSQPLEVQNLLLKRLCPIDRAVIQHAAVTYYDKSVFKVIATFLANRRIHLLRLARAKSDSAQRARYGRELKTSNLDTYASPVADELYRSGFIDEDTRTRLMPDYAWITSGTSVYFLLGCNQEAAQMLYDVGFTCVNELDPLGYSPVALLEVPRLTEHHGPYRINSPIDSLSRYISMLIWYTDRQAFWDLPYGVEHATPLHHISRRIGETFSSIPEVCNYAYQSQDTTTSSLQLPLKWDSIRQILAESVLFSEIFMETKRYDLYYCLCSHCGALPLNILLNGAFTAYYAVTKDRSSEGLLRLVRLLFSCKSSSDTICSISEIFRACMFACLGLTHTCRFGRLTERRMRNDPISPLKNNRLDRLVAFMVDRFLKSKMSLSEFIKPAGDLALCMKHLQIVQENHDPGDLNKKLRV